MRKKYLVVVYSAPPAQRDASVSSTTWAQQHVPQVKLVTASSTQTAASEAGVPAGGYALVSEYDALRRFDRAKQAPLEQKKPSGDPMDQIAAA